MKRLCAWAVAISAFLLSPALADDLDGWQEFRFGELLITLPKADDWNVTEEEDRIIAGRREDSWTGTPLGFEAVMIAEHPVPEHLNDWIDEELAMAYREWEVSNMLQYEDEPPRFELTDVNLGEVEINGQLFFTLKFFRKSKAPEVSGWTLERQELHLVFPPDYAAKQVFYKLFFMKVCFTTDCERADMGLSYLKQSLSTVRFQGQP